MRVLAQIFLPNFCQIFALFLSQFFAQFFVQVFAQIYCSLFAQLLSPNLLQFACPTFEPKFFAHFFEFLYFSIFSIILLREGSLCIDSSILRELCNSARYKYRQTEMLMLLYNARQ